MRWLKLIVKWLLTCLVVGFVAWEFVRQWSQLPKDAWLLDGWWLFLCGAVYMIAFVPSFAYWTWCLHLLGQPTPKHAIFRAYFVGHLGKYVPGKALVPIVRAALLNGVKVQPMAAILAVFYETLTCMAAGCFLVAGLLVVWSDAYNLASRIGEMLRLLILGNGWSRWVAVASFVGLGLAMLLPLIPTGFNRLAGWMIRRTGDATKPPLQGLSLEVLLVGLGIGLINWVLLGVSVWTALRAMTPIAWGLGECGLATLSVSAAVVLGFVSMLPGGLGVREGVLALLLAQAALVSAPQASLAAVVLRLVWMISEIIVAVGLLTPSALKWLMRSRLGRATQ